MSNRSLHFPLPSPSPASILAMLLTALAMSLAACYRPPAFPAGGAVSPQEAVAASIDGSDTAPHLFSTLQLNPDTSLVAFRGLAPIEGVHFGYAIARREASGWYTGLVSGSGYAGEPEEAVLHLVRLEDEPRPAVLYGVLVDPQVTGVELTLPDGARLPLLPRNGLLVYAFDLEQPPCTLTFTGTEGEAIAAADLVDRPELFTQIDPDIQQAVDDLCPGAENQ